MKLPDVKAKILLAPCQQNLLKCEVKMHKSQRSKSRTFVESKFVVFQQLNAITLDARS